MTTVGNVQNVGAESHYRACIREATPTYTSYNAMTESPKCSCGLNMINVSVGINVSRITIAQAPSNFLLDDPFFDIKSG